MRKRMIKGIVAAGAVLGGIDLFQDCGAVYAAEMEAAEQDDDNEILAELKMETEAVTCREMTYSESTLYRKPVAESDTWQSGESMGSETADKIWADLQSPAREAGIRTESAMEMPGWQQMKDTLAHSTRAHYSEEWRPTHGYRGLGSWELTRKAVEIACKNEGLELTAEELNQGANIWFYSGVTLQYFDAPYGSGWNAFAAWFEQVTSENTPNFEGEIPNRISTFLTRTDIGEEKPPLSVEAE